MIKGRSGFWSKNYVSVFKRMIDNHIKGLWICGCAFLIYRHRTSCLYLSRFKLQVSTCHPLTTVVPYLPLNLYRSLFGTKPLITESQESWIPRCAKNVFQGLFYETVMIRMSFFHADECIVFFYIIHCS